MVTTARYAGPRRRWPLVVAAVIVGVVVLFTALAGYVTDLMWFSEVGHEVVFWTTLRTKLLLGLAFGLVFGVAVYVNLVIARRLRPAVRPALTPDQEVIERFRDLATPYLRWAIPLGSIILGAIVGFTVSGEWRTFLVWRNAGGVSFGDPEPQFGLDPAYYIFTLPWLRFLQGWLFTSLVGITLLTAIAHVLWGGIRPQAPGFAEKVSPGVRAHLSVLLGLIMLVKAWGYWLGRYTLLSSKRGVVEGASYTDVEAQLPALTFLTIAAILCAVLFFLNIRLRQWSLPIIAVALLGLVSILLGAAYPAFVQRFQVDPNEQERETRYIDRNMQGTRLAFGLTEIEEEPFTGAVPITAQEAAENETTISNIRLWRAASVGGEESVLLENFQATQRIFQYYDFHDVDVDRYVIDGRPRVLMVGAREVSQDGITGGGQTWQNRHLAYTHGYGAVGSLVNTATSEGRPILTLQDLPPEGEPVLDQQRIYFGEDDDVGFVVVNTTTSELDFDGTADPSGYQGTGGIPLDDILTRAMFAWRFRDYNLLISSSITSDSKIMIYRDIHDRVQKPVPFLGFDADPYFAIVDGRPVWIWDAYTYAENYPYSQSVDLALATDNQLGGEVNYLANPVKAVVDAYDGSITYYTDLSEPIAQVWDRIFPGLFTDRAQAPASLQEHFRYPENLLQVQAYQYANYHVPDAAAFYNKSDFWEIPDDPTVGVRADGSTAKVRPYYQLLKLPGQASETFELVLPLVPEERGNLRAWLSASSDPGTYGRLTAFTYPEGRNVEGPAQVFARINQDPVFSGQRSLLGQEGSEVLFGELLIIPVEDSLLYIQPVYVRAEGEATVPELKRVLVVNGSFGDVALGNSLAEALDVAVEGEIDEPPPGGGEGSIRQRVERLLAEAQDHYENAQAALAAGDLGLYQEEVDAAADAIAQAQELLGGQEEEPEEPGATPTPSATASPSP
jgi:hypothetical protein